MSREQLVGRAGVWLHQPFSGYSCKQRGTLSKQQTCTGATGPRGPQGAQPTLKAVLECFGRAPGDGAAPVPRCLQSPGS